MQFKFIKAGYCSNIERITLKGGSMKKVKFPAMSLFIKSDKFNILFDTGYSSSFEEETKKLPYSIYAKTTPHVVLENEFVKNNVNESIDYIFISHFHADHIAGLRDFKNSKFICSRIEYEFLKDKKGISALVKGFIPKLLPDDFENRVVFIEDKKLIDNPIKNSVFTKVYDLFGDRKLLAVKLDGHSIGQYGLIINDKKKMFLIADATCSTKAYKERIYPSSIMGLIHHNFKEYKKTIDKLNKFYKEVEEDVLIIPTHDMELLEQIIASENI